MENTKRRTERVPPRIEWIEDVEYYPVYVNREIFVRFKGMKRTQIVDYCITKIVDESGNAMLSIDRNELMEQISDMFEAMGDTDDACNSFLILVRINNIVE